MTGFVLQGHICQLNVMPIWKHDFPLNCPSHEAYVDEKNKVISTPTFMWETDYHYHYIFDGIGNMVKHVMRMTAKWFPWDTSKTPEGFHT